MDFKEIERNDIKELTEVFIAAFNSPPWNDSWSFETACKRLEQMMDGEAAFGIAAYENTEPVGMILGCFEQYYDGVVFNIREFCVKKRGGGAGSIIFEEFENRLKSLGVKEITLNTLRGDATEGFYAKKGMKTDSGMAVMTKRL